MWFGMVLYYNMTMTCARAWQNAGNIVISYFVVMYGLVRLDLVC